MSRNEQAADRRRRRSALGVGTAAGAAFAAALISMGTAPSAKAITDGDVNPFEDLFGSTGFNSWTPAFDASLPATTAATLDGSVDSFNAFEVDQDPYTDLTLALDPSAFTVDPDHFTGGVPVNFIGDLAVGMDWLLSFSPGLGASIDTFFESLVPGGLP
jgi:hypothetical protein